MKLHQLWMDFRSTPVATLGRWQDHRFPWLLMAATSAAMLVVAHSLFQNYLYMRPCEQCVYTRFAFLLMMIGGLVTAINPRLVALKLVGLRPRVLGRVYGIGVAMKLDRIHHAVHSDNPFGVQGCSTDPVFPLGTSARQVVRGVVQADRRLRLRQPDRARRHAAVRPAAVARRLLRRRLVPVAEVALHEHGAGHADRLRRVPGRAARLRSSAGSVDADEVARARRRKPVMTRAA